MKIDYVTSGQLCRILRRVDGSPLSVVTLADWLAAGVITCSIPACGTGNQRRFSLIESLVAALYAGLVGAGYGRSQALAAAKLLHGVSRAKLERQFAAGRHFIAIAGVQASGLLTRPEVSALMRRNLTAIQTSEAAGNILASPFAVDLTLIWRSVLADVATFEAEETARRSGQKKQKVLA